MENLTSYTEDIRTVPTDDNTRLPAFKTGWTEAGKKENDDDTIPEKYKDEPTLDKLTWENLGFRLGTLFGGETPEPLREELYNWCVNQQKETENR